MKERRFPLLIGASILATALLLAGGLALAQERGPRANLAPQAPLGTGFTYQGRLQSGGAHISGTCQMAFRLYDADAPSGVQVGSAITRPVEVGDGYFTEQLDFGSDAFDGEARWLGIKIKCAGDGDYTDLGRQALTAVPYALYALKAPWSGVIDAPAAYTPTAHTHAGSDVTSAVPTATLALNALSAPWTGLTDAPDGLDDGDDVVTYTAGAGLALTATEFRAEGSPYANVVVVAKSGGDFTSVQEAIDSITDASSTNPYLVWIAPGVYDEAGEEGSTMRPYVHLQGSGQEATVIAETVNLTHHVSLRDLTVGGYGTSKALQAGNGVSETLIADVTARALRSGSFNWSIYVSGDDTSIALRNVTALAENGISGNTGLRNDNALVIVHDSYFTARGIDSCGIHNFSGVRMTAHNVTALAEGSGDETCALRNHYQVTVTLQGGSFTARGGGEVWGIYNNDTVLDAEGVIVLAEEAVTATYGIYNVAGADVTLRGGSFTARGGQEARAIHNGSIYGSAIDLTAQSITALAEGAGEANYGLYNPDRADVTLRGGSFTGRGGRAAAGLYSSGSGSTLEAESVTAVGEFASGTGSKNYGLHNRSDAEATLRGGSFTALGGSDSDNYGLMNESGTATLYGGAFVARDGLYATGVGSYGALTAQSITALGVGATNFNYGLEHSGLDAADLTQSVFEGASYSILRSSGDVLVSNSRLIDGATNGAMKCLAVSYGNSWYEGSCP